MPDDILLLVARDGQIVDTSASAAAIGAPGRACRDAVGVRAPSGGSPCSPTCADALVACRGRCETVGTLRGGGSARVVCTALADGVVVRVEPLGSAPSPLTPREVEVLALIADGLTTRRIARRLGVSFATARTHVEHVRDKLGARTRAEAVARAVALGWLTAR